MITQENKWNIMTTVGMPWSEIGKLSEEDLKFLLKKADEIQSQLQQQQFGNTGGDNVNLRPPNYT